MGVRDGYGRGTWAGPNENKTDTKMKWETKI